MKNIVYLFALVTSMAFFSSCSDDDGSKGSVVEVSSPTELQVYKPKDVVLVKYRMNDASGIFQYNIEVMNEEEKAGGFYIKEEYGFNYLVNEFNESYSFTLPGGDSEQTTSLNGVYDIKFTVLNRRGVITTFVRKIKIQNTVQ